MVESNYHFTIRRSLRFAPSFAEKILKMKGQEGALQIQLKGIGIGDGFTDPNVITQEMPSFAYNMGLIDYKER